MGKQEAKQILRRYDHTERNTGLVDITLAQ